LAGPPTNTGKGNVQPRKLAKPRTFDISRWADKIFHSVIPFPTHNHSSIMNAC
jgi:cytochrome P450